MTMAVLASLDPDLWLNLSPASSPPEPQQVIYADKKCDVKRDSGGAEAGVWGCQLRLGSRDVSELGCEPGGSRSAEMFCLLSPLLKLLREACQSGQEE